MKKKLKQTNRFKLALNVNKLWFFFNINSFEKKHQIEQLLLFENVHSLQNYYNRGINLLIKFIFFESLFRVKKKKKLLFYVNKYNLFFNFLSQNFLINKKFILFIKKKKNKIKKLLFRQRKLKKKKKFLSSFKNFFSFFNLNKIILYKTNFNLICLLFINHDFFPVDLKELKIFSKNPQRQEKYHHDYYARKVLQYLFLLKIKYLFEKQLTNLFQMNTIIHWYSPYADEVLELFRLKNDQETSFNRNLIPYKFAFQIKKLYNLKTQLYFSIINGFLQNNPQIIVDQLAYGLHRIRSHKQYFKWIAWQLEKFKHLLLNIRAVKFIACGKYGAGTQTQYHEYFFSDFTSQKQTDQIFALKVKYAYISAESFTGTFGFHLWIYEENDTFFANNIKFNKLNY
jgi:hypothetical protein